MAKWVVFIGSPRANGTSALLADCLVEQLSALHPEIVFHTYAMSDFSLKGCIGCDFCQGGSCVYQDDMAAILDDVCSADGVVVVSPIYFSSVPSQFKALLDRFQPLFWKRQELLRAKRDLPPKKPLVLYVVGEGGDPHGFEGLESVVRSSFALADFFLSQTIAYIGNQRFTKTSSLELPEVLRG